MILIKLVCFFKLFLNQSLEAFCQLFSWTSVGLSGCLIDQMIRSQGNLRVWVYPRVQHYIIQKLCQSCLRTPSQKLFWKLLKFKMRHCKNFQCTLSKICLYHQTVIDQRPTIFHQLFSWTFVALSKFPIDKMVDSQGQLRVSAIPWKLCVLSENSFTKIFLKVIKM